MANGSFVNLDRQVVARGLQRLLDQGIGTTKGGVPSFTDTDMRAFLTAKNLDTPTTLPNQPLEDTVGSIAIDQSLRVSQDLSGVLAIDDRITEALARKNEIAAQNLNNIDSDPLVASSLAALNEAQMDAKLNFVRDQTPIIQNRIDEASASLIQAQDRARQNSAIKTAAEVSEIDNDILRLKNRKQSLEKLIADQEAREPNIPVHVQEMVTAAEGIEDLRQIQKTWDTLNPENQQMIKLFAGQPEGKFFAWHEPIVQDVDRDGMIAMIKSRLSVTKGQRFTEMIPQMDKLLQDAQAEALEALPKFQGGQQQIGAPPMNSAEAAAWVNNRIGVTMDNQTGEAFNTFAKRAVSTAITREGFSSDEIWRVAQTLQANLDPTQANLPEAISTALSNMPPMDKEFRTRLIKEYMRGMQNIFNEPRAAFGMGINQVTIDTLADDISSRMVRVDLVKQKQDLLREQLVAMGITDVAGVDRTFMQSGAPLGERPFGVRQREELRNRMIQGGTPDSRASITPSTETAVDVALAPVTAAATARGQVEDPRIIAARARTVKANNPGLTDEEAANIASGQSGGLSSFLNDLNPEEITLVLEQLKNAALGSTDPGEQNMFDLLLKKIERFAVESRQPQAVPAPSTVP